MNAKTYLVISGVVFGLVALGHAVRLITRWPIVIGPFSIPVWASGLAVLAGAGLCVWAFRLTREEDGRQGEQ